MDEPRKFDDVISRASNFDNFSGVFIYVFPCFSIILARVLMDKWFSFGGNLQVLVQS